MRKLTPDEITAAVAKIRAKYEDYIWRYFKPRSVRGAFEDRYLQALRNGVDVSSFLIAEIGAIEELNRREEAKLGKQAEQGGANGKATRSVDVSATEGILQKQRELIEGYRDAAFHRDADPELRRMLGALSTLLSLHWLPLQKALRNSVYSSRSTVMVGLDHELRFLGRELDDGPSAGLGHYVALLRAFPRDSRSLEREQKNYLLAASFMLHDLEELLARVEASQSSLGEEGLRVVVETRQYVAGVVDNFRLRHLRRRR